MNSSIFEVISTNNLRLNSNSDGVQWDYSDEKLQQLIPSLSSHSDEDFVFAILNVPIEKNWFSRIIDDNLVIFSFHKVRDILTASNIPLDNIISRLLYAYTLTYLYSDNKIPNPDKMGEFKHDETRGCLFDMNGLIEDLVVSCDKPIICDWCKGRLTEDNKISLSVIDSVRSEIKKIRKDVYYRVSEYVKRHPILVLVISSFFVLSIGVISSVIGSCVADLISPS